MAGQSTCNYSKMSIQSLKDKKIPFVEYNSNPTNLPQCRPIEDFFGVLSQIIYKNNWKARNVHILQKRIRWALTKVENGTVNVFLHQLEEG